MKKNFQLFISLVLIITLMLSIGADALAVADDLPTEYVSYGFGNLYTAAVSMHNLAEENISIDGISVDLRCENSYVFIRLMDLASAKLLRENTDKLSKLGLSLGLIYISDGDIMVKNDGLTEDEISSMKAKLAEFLQDAVASLSTGDRFELGNAGTVKLYVEIGDFVVNEPATTPEETPVESPVPSETSVAPVESPVPSETPVAPVESPAPSETPVSPVESPVPSEMPVAPVESPVPSETPVPSANPSKLNVSANVYIYKGHEPNVARRKEVSTLYIWYNAYYSTAIGETIYYSDGTSDTTYGTSRIYLVKADEEHYDENTYYISFNGVDYTKMNDCGDYEGDFTRDLYTKGEGNCFGLFNGDVKTIYDTFTISTTADSTGVIKKFNVIDATPNLEYFTSEEWKNDAKNNDPWNVRRLYEPNRYPNNLYIHPDYSPEYGDNPILSISENDPLYNDDDATFVDATEIDVNIYNIVNIRTEEQSVDNQGEDATNEQGTDPEIPTETQAEATVEMPSDAPVEPPAPSDASDEASTVE